MIIRTVVIGAGSSGSRFIRAAHYVDSLIGKIEIIGVAEINPEKLQALSGAGIRLEKDFRKLLDSVECELIIISTTDSSHYEILEYIKDKNIPFKKIVCEKPIVTDEKHCRFVQHAFDNNQISVSFVERYSLAVSELKNHIERERRSVSSATFVWSKYRIKDVRPTVGVTSEITHPIDLACYLAAVRDGDNSRFHFSCIRESNYIRGGELRPETMMACVEFVGGMVVSGTSSYVQSERCRTMEFLPSDESSQVVEIAVLRLDSPKWDDDYLSIFRIDVNDHQPKLVFSYRTPPNKCGPRQCIDKVCLFLEDVIKDINGRASSALPDKSQAILVQNIVNKFGEGPVIKRHVFSEGYHVSNDEDIERLKGLAELIKFGDSKEAKDDWSSRY